MTAVLKQKHENPDVRSLTATQRSKHQCGCKMKIREASVSSITSKTHSFLNSLNSTQATSSSFNTIFESFSLLFTPPPTPLMPWYVRNTLLSPQPFFFFLFWNLWNLKCFFICGNQSCLTYGTYVTHSSVLIIFLSSCLKFKMFFFF